MPQARSGPRAAAVARPSVASRHERWIAAALLLLHAGLVVWCIGRNSVTFDENFHLPAGVLYLTRGQTEVSLAQPPLARALCALPALAWGARAPREALEGWNEEVRAGFLFMQDNAARYVTLFTASRLVPLAMSLALGFLLWRWARALYGGAAGLFALGLWTVSPEALAHAGVVGVDMATALAFVLAILAFQRFAASGRWRDAAWLVVAVGVAALVRFTAIQLAVILPILLLIAQRAGTVPTPRRAWAVLAVLVPTTLVALQIGYLGQTTWQPLGARAFHSSAMGSLQHLVPWAILPLPDGYVGGLDYLALLSQSGKASYLMGQVRTDAPWYYLPVALLVKWPLGLLALLGLRLAAGGRLGARVAPAVIVPAIVILVAALASRLNFGVRYVLPALPFLCVWVAALLAPSPASGPSRRGLSLAALVLLAAVALESLTALPYPLSFFNRAAGGPGRGDHIVNDSNVDWGQGLVALRDEMTKRGIERVHLAYHGTTDPARYGIDYALYTGGTPGPESDWLAVSSYFFVGLPARLTTSQGVSTSMVTIDFRSLQGAEPVARPAHCMYLFRVR